MKQFYIVPVYQLKNLLCDAMNQNFTIVYIHDF